MLLDRPNAELLKLVALCKDFPCDFALSDVPLFSDINISRLITEGLITKSRDGRFYRVSPAGYDLLAQMGYYFHVERFRENRKDALDRRCASAQVMATLMLAGVDVFTTNLTQLDDGFSYLPMSTIRRLQMEQGRNSLGNTRFTGLTNRFVFYYMADPSDVLHYGNEVKTFSDLRAGIGGSDTNLAGDASPAVIYAGKSYHSLCAAVTSPAGDVPSYRTAYDAFELPIYLCPCGVDGAIQLRVMLQPDYRKRIIKSAYTPGAIKPPSPRFGDSDGTLGGEPLVLGVDMDLHRLDAVITAAQNKGAAAHILARECQNKDLYEVYQDKQVRLYNLTDSMILKAFGFTSLVYNVPLEPFITEEGNYIHEETIMACRDARKRYRKKGKATQMED